MRTQAWDLGWDCSLLRIVSGVSKYPGINSPEDPIKALHDTAILVSIDEVIIE